MKKENRTTAARLPARKGGVGIANKMLNDIIKKILHSQPFAANRAFNSSRYRLRNGKMEETTIFRILRAAGWQVREEKKENGGVCIHVDPPKL